MAGSRPSVHARGKGRPSTAGVVVAACVTLLAACDHYAAAGPAPTETPNPTPAPAAAGARQLERVTCAPADPANPNTVVQMLRRDDGSCVPMSEAVVYRCDPSFEPVAVLAASDRSRMFLGGRFAVPTSSIPSQAQAVGVAAAGRLWVVPGNDRWLYVESGGVSERWLLLPGAESLGDPPSAAMIGDSILDGATPALEAGLSSWTLAIDAEIGRSAYGGVASTEALAATVPDAVVVELGTNDHDAGAFRTSADQIATTANRADLILWVTAHNSDSATPGVNREILDVIAGMPNGTVADWDTDVPLDELSSDGVHLLAGSEGAFAEFLIPFLSTWVEAVRGQGATSCADEVLEHNGH